MSKKGIVVTWGKSITRSKSLARELMYDDFHSVPRFSGKYLKVVNYFISFFETVGVLFKVKPEVVVVVAPPVFSVYAVFLYKLFFGIDRVVIDLHNGVLRKEWRFWPFWKFLLKNGEAVISHNNVVKDSIDEAFDVFSIVLSDPVASFSINNADVNVFLSEFKKNILVPVSYAKDEPIREILDAAKMMSEDYNFILTGNYKKVFSDQEAESLPVTFTGYVSELEYQSLVLKCDAMLCLTRNDDIQMCALVEAISNDKNVVCSDNSVNRYLFSGYVDSFVGCDSKSIRDGIEKSLSLNCHVSKSSVDDYRKFWRGVADEIFE